MNIVQPVVSAGRYAIPVVLGYGRTAVTMTAVSCGSYLLGRTVVKAAERGLMRLSDRTNALLQERLEQAQLTRKQWLQTEVEREIARRIAAGTLANLGPTPAYSHSEAV